MKGKVSKMVINAKESGWYRCEASNKIGRDSKTIQFFVTGELSFLHINKTASAEFLGLSWLSLFPLFLILARIKKSPVKYHLFLVLETLFISKCHIIVGIHNGFGIEVNQSEVREGTNVTVLCLVNEFMYNMTNLYWTKGNSSKRTDVEEETKFTVTNFRYIALLC